MALIDVLIGPIAAIIDKIIPDKEAQAKAKPDTEVQLRADRVVPYERVAQLIGILQKAGLTRIAFVTEAAEGVPAPVPGKP